MTNRMKLSGCDYVKKGALFLFRQTVFFVVFFSFIIDILQNICNLVCLPNASSIVTHEFRNSQDSQVGEWQHFEGSALGKGELGVVLYKVLLCFLSCRLSGIKIEYRGPSTTAKI